MEISTRTHGLIDYSVGAGLLAAPNLLGWERGSDATAFTRTMGAAAIAYSLIPRYELGAWKLMPMPVHLKVDWAWIGAMMAAPPLLGFGRRQPSRWALHALVAATAAVVVCATRTEGHAE